MWSISIFKKAVRHSRLSLGSATLALMFAAGVVNADGGAEHQTTQLPPIKLGSSGSNIESVEEGSCFTGTLGGLVEDSDGTSYIVSNNHVLVPPGGQLGTAVLQAGLADTECSPTGNTVATLSDFVPIEFCKLAGPWVRCNVNTVDAAIAAVENCGQELCVESNGEILNIGPLHTNSVTASLGMEVQKSGRTTGHTIGTVSAIDVEIYVCYSITEDECQQVENVALFRNQVAVNGDGFSAGGDSGSIIAECVSDDNGGCQLMPKAVGLLFAGGGGSTFFNPIDEVLSKLSIAMAGCGSACFGGGDDSGKGSKGGNGGNGNGGGRPSSASDQTVGLEIGRNVRSQNAERLRRIEGVVGTGVGVDKNGNAVIQVYVKNASVRLVDDPIPTEIDGVMVRVIETGVIRAY